MERLSGLVALVTGGGSGIGEAICRRFDAEGARVAVLDVSEPAAMRVSAAIRDGLPLVADVSEPHQVDAAISEAVAEMGSLDVLVNNAGIGSASPRRENGDEDPRPQSAQLEVLGYTASLGDGQWYRMLNVHLSGTFFCTRAALRVMLPHGAGAIVNMASICGIQGCEGYSDYSAAKAGILGFTRSVAREVAPKGVRVNAVAPGYIDTPMLARTARGEIERQLSITPSGRLGRPDEVAAAVTFLASPESSYFVGETLSPNGGSLCV